MAAPTQAEVETQISNVIRLWQNFRNYASVTASTNFIDNEDTLVQSLEGEYIPELMGGIARFRSTLAAAMGLPGSAIAPLLSEMGRVINAPERGTMAIFSRLYDFMADNSQAVTSRVFTFGTITADGSNVGDGVINRLTTDARGYGIENCTAEAKEMMVIADQYSGATEYEELFQFTGSDAEKDNLRVTGSGLVSAIRAVSAADSLTGNSSWTNFAGTTAVPTSITDWTPGADIANFEIDQTNFYRGDPDDGDTPASLKFTANDYVEQKFSVRNVTLSPSVPYWCSIAYNRQVGSGDGDLTLWMGDQYKTVTLASETGWNLLSIDLGTSNWLRTFNSSDPSIKINLASNTTGTVLVDDLIFTPMQPFDGTFWLPVGGPVNFLYVPGTGDKFTVTDTEAGTAILQYWMWRAYGSYLPHATGGSVTWADPT